MTRRYMQNPRTERRIIDGALWLIAGGIILIILTSCSPYQAGSSTTAQAWTTGATIGFYFCIFLAIAAAIVRKIKSK